LKELTLAQTTSLAGTTRSCSSRVGEVDLFRDHVPQCLSVKATKHKPIANAPVMQTAYDERELCVLQTVESFLCNFGA